jgi:hypothetical protein
MIPGEGKATSSMIRYSSVPRSGTSTRRNDERTALVMSKAGCALVTQPRMNVRGG